jgi:hypothetical protein
MELIKNYEKAIQEIYDHVGFVEDWVVAPIDDCTDKFWDYNDDEVFYADSEEELKSESGQYYTDSIYKQRFYKKWVYVGKDFTMIFCDPHVDGMKWFRIFDNNKQQK